MNFSVSSLCTRTPLNVILQTKHAIRPLCEMLLHDLCELELNFLRAFEEEILTFSKFEDYLTLYLFIYAYLAK